MKIETLRDLRRFLEKEKRALAKQVETRSIPSRKHLVIALWTRNPNLDCSYATIEYEVKQIDSDFNYALLK